MCSYATTLSWDAQNLNNCWLIAASPRPVIYKRFSVPGHIYHRVWYLPDFSIARPVDSETAEMGLGCRPIGGKIPTEDAFRFGSPGVCCMQIVEQTVSILCCQGFQQTKSGLVWFERCRTWRMRARVREDSFERVNQLLVPYSCKPDGGGRVLVCCSWSLIINALKYLLIKRWLPVRPHG